MSINVGQAIGYLDLDTSGFQRGFKSALQDLRAFNDNSATATTKLGALGSAFQSAGSAMTKNLTVPIAGAGAAVAGVAAKFESAMSEVAAISGASGDELQALTDKAQEMGATTKFSASESAAALKYMAMAGWDTKAMLNGINGVMQLAAASGEDLASTSDIVTDAMTAFGLSADQSTRFADVLAQTANRSNTSVALMGETFKYVAPVAGALGYSIEDASVAIGLMANSGIKGSQAGTSLKNVLTNLAKPTDQVQSYMDKLKISLTDSAGNVKPLNQLLNEMRDGFNGLTEAEKAEYAAGIAGKEGMSGLLAIVNSSQADFDNLTEAINNSNGAAQNVADVMMDNLGGQLTILKSTLEGIAISFGNILLPAVKKVVDSLQDFLNWLNGLTDDQKQFIVTVAAVVAAIGPVLLIIGKLITSVTNIIKVVRLLSAGFAGITAPVAAIIAAVIALVAAFKTLWDNNEEFRTKITEIWEGIKSKFEEFSKGIVDRLNSLGFSFEDITDVLKSVWEGLCNFLAPIFEGAFSYVGIILETALDVLTGIFDVFSGIFTGDWKKVWTGVKEIFEALWNKIKNTVKNLLNTILRILGTDLDTIRAKIKSVIDDILNWFKELPGKMLEIGKNILKGLADGILNTVDTVKNTVSDVANSILNTFKSIFDIHSPSKETAEMGSMLMQGLAGGVSDSSDVAMNAVMKMADMLVTKLGTLVTQITQLMDSAGNAIQPFGIGDSEDRQNLKLYSQQVINLYKILTEQSTTIITALDNQKAAYDRVTLSIQQQIVSLQKLQALQAATLVARTLSVSNSALSRFSSDNPAKSSSVNKLPAQSLDDKTRWHSGNTYVFNSPIAVTPTVAAKKLKQTSQQISMNIK